MERVLRDKLDAYYQEVALIILSRQNASTGLIPASVAHTHHGDYRDAWVRDNVYSILVVWGLALAYRRVDDGQGRAFELEHATVKCMRGLLSSMIRQADKVERFKNTQDLGQALHAKYNTSTGSTVVGDWEWGHLQLDATSIFLLMLAQMTSSGLQIIFTLDEVAFIQNLTFYIERAYRTPDFGLWERGNKLNHGLPELNSSSIGMVVAALQAINGINLFGARGGPSSVIHVLPDEIIRNYTTLISSLPRESASKEVDAALLSVISFPAFAVADPKIVERTRNSILSKLGGVYGCKRFLRDGHQTEIEDTSRLHYDSRELKEFEHIECEWPLFFTYLILDGLFSDDRAMVDKFRSLLEQTIVVKSYTASGDEEDLGIPESQNLKLIPELYKVPKELIAAEKKQPGSQKRLPNENIPLVWAQSLYLLGNMISDKLLTPADIDPLGRRFYPHGVKANLDVVVQLVVLAENRELQEKLLTYGLESQTVESCSPVTISLPTGLKEAYFCLGQNQKLGLTGRPKRPVGTLSTCKLYRYQGRLYAFLPHFMDKEEFYLVSDTHYLASLFEQELQFIKNHWFGSGRPTLVVMITNEMFEFPSPSSEPSHMLERNDTLGPKRPGSYSSSGTSRKGLLNLFNSLKNGLYGGVRIRMGRLSDMISTSCIESLDFLQTCSSLVTRDWLSLFSYTKSSSENHLTQRVAPHNRDRRTSLSSMGEGTPKSPLASPYVLDDLQDELIAGGFKLRDPSEEEPSHFVHAPTPHSSPRRRSFASKDQTQSSLMHSLNDLNLDSAKRILTLRLGDPSQLGNAQTLLQTCANLHDQLDLLHYIQSCKAFDFVVPQLGKVSDLLEEVYKKAMRLKQWTVVRHAAGLLKKVVNNLSLNIADLLIRQKPVTVGHGSHEYSLGSPMSPSALSSIIFAHCTSDVREAPLVQEVITYLGSLIRSKPAIFDGIMRIRTHFIIIAVREEISRVKAINEDDAVEQMMRLSPFELKTLITEVLTAHDQDSTDGPTSLFSRRKSFSDISPTNPETIGRHNASSLLSVGVQSAGFLDGNYANITIDRDGCNLLDFANARRGMNMVTVDPFDGTILSIASFDTHGSADDTEELAKRLEWVEPGVIVVIAGMDDCWKSLTESAKVAIESIGSSKIRDVGFRDSWVIIGEKGAARGSAIETLTQSSKGPSKGSRIFDLAQKRERVLLQATAGGGKSLSTHNMSLNHLLPSSGRWLRRRKNDGALNRVPNQFYVQVWHLLSNVQGIKVMSQILPRDPTISEKTPEEFNFALEFEKLLDNIKDPSERQIAVECLVVIYKLGDRNPEFHISSDILDIAVIIRETIRKYWDKWVQEQGPNLVVPVDEHNSTSKSVEKVKSDACRHSFDFAFEKHERFARLLFYDLPQDGNVGSMACLANTCARSAFEVSWTGTT